MTKKNIQHPAQKILTETFINLPTPSSISYLWNWGSIIGLTLLIQILTGILLACHYNSSLNEAFNSTIEITRNINFGFELRFIHINTASFFFIFIFIHISRGLLISSFKFTSTWRSGMVIIFILIATAFLGYVLPWGQISFWGATVITNLLSAIPYIGNSTVQWLWGGFSINKATLTRFFALHFIIPIILRALVVIHLTSLHITGSNKPVGANPNLDKIPFHPYFSSKDLIPALLFIMSLLIFSFMAPFILNDPENFNVANPLNTPIHIQPEWYFLFAYAILRSIPNKLGGVVSLVLSILMLLALTIPKKNKTSKKFIPNIKNNFWVFSVFFILLTWAGAMPVEPPYEQIRKILSIWYFIFLLSN